LLAVVVITIAAGIDDIHPNGEASLQPTLDSPSLCQTFGQ
jgi:hypothetical protein